MAWLTILIATRENDAIHTIESESYKVVPFTCGSSSTFTNKVGDPAEGLVQVDLVEPIEMHKKWL